VTRSNLQNVLVIGDTDRQVQSALAQALPGAQITNVPNYFDAIAELSAARFNAVLASAEPIERRPESAVRTIRQLTGDGRFILFGQSSLEPVSRKMLGFGCDDYIITPTTPGELGQIFGAPLRLSGVSPEDTEPQGIPISEPARIAILNGLPLAEIVLDAIVQNPQGGPEAAVRAIDGRISPALRLHYARSTPANPNPGAPEAPEGSIAISHEVRVNTEPAGELYLIVPKDEEESAARHFLAHLAGVIGKIVALETRHIGLQKLAITDDLTGLYNARYFRHFLTKIIDKARIMRFPVTLLLFDIDGFKTYNDQYGHGVGDEILRQTSALIRRCVRDHDLVARLGGDEFAVVFWEKEGPRQPRDSAKAPPIVSASRIPQTPRQMFMRVQRLLASDEFNILGTAGQGHLTISGAMAVYPYDAGDVNSLIEAADRELMFNAKASGKNCLKLVGENSNNHAETPEG
jgi:PleD family two-component response regulator